MKTGWCVGTRLSRSRGWVRSKRLIHYFRCWKMKTRWYRRRSKGYWRVWGGKQSNHVVTSFLNVEEPHHGGRSSSEVDSNWPQRGPQEGRIQPGDRTGRGRQSRGETARGRAVGV